MSEFVDTNVFLRFLAQDDPAKHQQCRVLRALDLYGRTNLDFEDCMSVEHTRRLRLDGIYSYDRGFDRIPEIRRLEP
ncbi:MAG: hypothetical protein HYX51_05500 [Chloroflexi bacterium]|nr:hypothetical protein [Chloroflexota bacterium]